MKCGRTEVLGLALVVILQGCGSRTQQGVELAHAIGKAPNCPSLRDQLWTELYRQIDRDGALPSITEIAPELGRTVKSLRTRNALLSLYGKIARPVRGLGREEALRVLAEMEIGDRTTEEKDARQDEIERSLVLVRTTASQELGECPSPVPGNPLPPETMPSEPTPVGSNTPNPIPSNAGNPDPVRLFEFWRKRVSSTIYGAYKTISIAYQSCNLLEQDPLLISTPDVEGIVVTGTHPNGVGKRREVVDVSAVFRTNPFYATRVSPGANCFPDEDTPLIYDYGGKPYAGGAGAGMIDLFKNAGSGTSALGIDCSGFVSSAILSGGLRFKAGTSSKAYQVAGVNAAMFADPKRNGLTCYSPVMTSATAKLMEGDIIANSGHVVIADQVGLDPFGIARIQKAEDCVTLTSSGFDFTIIQSSSGKNGIGMNRYRASDFLAEYNTMRTGLESYARSFCKARFGSIGLSKEPGDPSLAVIIRHMDVPACLDQRIPLIGESCMKNCAAL